MRKIFLLFGVAVIMMMSSSCNTIYHKIKYSNKSIEISNNCENEELDFKLISLIGDKKEQTIVLNGRFINRDVNKDLRVGGNLIAYDTEGVPHNSNRSTQYEALTDKKVYFSLEIPGKAVPRKVKKMAIIAFDIDNCRVELRNVPIIWKKIKDEKK